MSVLLVIWNLIIHETGPDRFHVQRECARNFDISQWQKQTKKLSTKHPLMDGIQRGFKVQLKGHIVFNEEAITKFSENMLTKFLKLL